MFLALAGGAEPLDLPGAPLDDETVQICLPGLLEGWKNLLEALRAQAGERLDVVPRRCSRESGSGDLSSPGSGH